MVVLQVKAPATASIGWRLGLWGIGRPARDKKLYFKRIELDDWLTGQKITTYAEIKNDAVEYIRRKGRFKF